jgi:2-haloacid dehalogenase
MRPIRIGNYDHKGISPMRNSILNALHQGSESAIIDVSSFEVLTFDCYGTLIDWGTGIVSALGRFLSKYNLQIKDEHILKLYAEFESKAEEGPFIRYRQVLREVVKQLGQTFGFRPMSGELDCLADSLISWKPFPGTLDALRALNGKYRLAIISNIDDDLLSTSLTHLGVQFDWIITSEQAKAYKPSHRIFELAIRRIGISREKILHVAQSIYHDINPAKAMGLSTLWINHAKLGGVFGATPPAYGHPDLEVANLKTLVTLAGL